MSQDEAAHRRSYDTVSEPGIPPGDKFLNVSSEGSNTAVRRCLPIFSPFKRYIFPTQPPLLSVPTQFPIKNVKNWIVSENEKTGSLASNSRQMQRFSTVNTTTNLKYLIPQNSSIKTDNNIDTVYREIKRLQVLANNLITPGSDLYSSASETTLNSEQSANDNSKKKETNFQNIFPPKSANNPYDPSNTKNSVKNAFCNPAETISEESSISGKSTLSNKLQQMIPHLLALSGPPRANRHPLNRPYYATRGPPFPFKPPPSKFQEMQQPSDESKPSKKEAVEAKYRDTSEVKQKFSLSQTQLMARSIASFQSLKFRTKNTKPTKEKTVAIDQVNQETSSSSKKSLPLTNHPSTSFQKLNDHTCNAIPTKEKTQDGNYTAMDQVNQETSSFSNKPLPLTKHPSTISLDTNNHTSNAILTKGKTQDGNCTAMDQVNQETSSSSNKSLPLMNQPSTRSQKLNVHTSNAIPTKGKTRDGNCHAMNKVNQETSKSSKKSLPLMDHPSTSFHNINNHTSNAILTKGKTQDGNFTAMDQVNQETSSSSNKSLPLMNQPSTSSQKLNVHTSNAIPTKGKTRDGNCYAMNKVNQETSSSSNRSLPLMNQPSTSSQKLNVHTINAIPAKGKTQDGNFIAMDQINQETSSSSNKSFPLMNHPSTSSQKLNVHSSNAILTKGKIQDGYCTPMDQVNQETSSSSNKSLPLMNYPSTSFHNTNNHTSNAILTKGKTQDGNCTAMDQVNQETSSSSNKSLPLMNQPSTSSQKLNVHTSNATPTKGKTPDGNCIAMDQINQETSSSSNKSFPKTSSQKRNFNSIKIRLCTEEAPEVYYQAMCRVKKASCLKGQANTHVMKTVTTNTEKVKLQYNEANKEELKITNKPKEASRFSVQAQPLEPKLPTTERKLHITKSKARNKESLEGKHHVMGQFKGGSNFSRQETEPPPTYSQKLQFNSKKYKTKSSVGNHQNMNQFRESSWFSIQTLPQPTICPANSRSYLVNNAEPIRKTVQPKTICPQKQFVNHVATSLFSTPQRPSYSHVTRHSTQVLPTQKKSKIPEIAQSVYEYKLWPSDQSSSSILQSPKHRPEDKRPTYSQVMKASSSKSDSQQNSSCSQDQLIKRSNPGQSTSNNPQNTGVKPKSSRKLNQVQQVADPRSGPCSSRTLHRYQSLGSNSTDTAQESFMRGYAPIPIPEWAAEYIRDHEWIENRPPMMIMCGGCGFKVPL